MVQSNFNLNFPIKIFNPILLYIYIFNELLYTGLPKTGSEFSYDSFKGIKVFFLCAYTTFLHSYKQLAMSTTTRIIAIRYYLICERQTFPNNAIIIYFGSVLIKRGGSNFFTSRRGLRTCNFDDFFLFFTYTIN